jgi:hypothetical protein
MVITTRVIHNTPPGRCTRVYVCVCVCVCSMLPMETIQAAEAGIKSVSSVCIPLNIEIGPEGSVKVIVIVSSK